MNSEFILLNKTYQTVDYINKILLNYPKKELIIKNYIERCLYEMIESLFNYNINETKRIREKYLKDYLVKLSMINYLMRESLIKKCITYKQSETIGKILLDLKKISSKILKGFENENSISDNS